MREAVVVASARTGLAKSFRGSFNMTRPDEMAAHCIREVLAKAPHLDPAEVEDVILGCAEPHGPQGMRKLSPMAGMESDGIIFERLGCQTCSTPACSV